MERNRPLTQQYDRYTPEDFTVWQTLFERQMNLLNQYASASYLDAIDKIGFHAAAIPDFSNVNEKLLSLTGWQLTVVPGLVPQKEFFEMLAQRIFPATCWLRTFAEIDYIEEPDMFHDVFGHVPLLANSEYASFMQAFGMLALEWINQPEIVDLLSRIYWFTVEFGLINEAGNIRIYGAGVLSSPGETMNSMKEDMIKRRFNAADILRTGYKTDVLQEQYFIIDNYAQLDNMLTEVKQLINNAEKLFLLSNQKQLSIL